MKNIKTNGYTHVKADAKRARKRQEAESRAAAYRSLTTEEKLIQAKDRRGESRREVERIFSAMPA